MTSKRFHLYAYDNIADEKKLSGKVDSFDTLEEMLIAAKEALRHHEYIALFDEEKEEFLQPEEYGLFRQ